MPPALSSRRLGPTRRWLIALAGIGTLAVTSACGVGQYSTDSTSGGEPAATAQSGDSGTSGSSGSSTSSASADSAAAFKAGTYDEDGSYQTPGGEQSVEVEVTIDDTGTIENIVVTPQAESGNSVQFQGQFAGGIADEVVGKKIDELNVSKVAGSSLTSGGFNQAIDEIIAEARA